MIVYSGNKYSFQRDVINGNVARRLDDLFVEMGIRRESLAEFNSWKASLQRMALIMADRIIRNTYKTLLSRGQKGCYIYCEDAKLRDYLRLRLEQVTRKQQEVPHDTANHR